MLKNLKSCLKKLKTTPVIYINPTDAANKHSLDKQKPLTEQENWDELGKSVLSTIIFKSFRERLSGSDWESTDLYKWRKRKGRNLAKFTYWDSMLNDIVENGYSFKSLKRDPIGEYMSILIGCYGHMFIYNGIHRFCSCLLSKKPGKIPVKVLYRHPEWEDFKTKCSKYKQQLYCQLPHPDLKQIPFKWTNERADLIAENSLYPNGTLVDIGAHWGTISYTLAQKGFNVLAVENSLAPYKFLERISKFPGKPFSITKSNFTNMKINADTLSMLNIAHHFIIDKDRHKKFIQFLNNLNVKEIFYQAHGIKSKWTKHIDPLAFLGLIISETKMTKAKELKTFDERTLYHLT